MKRILCALIAAAFLPMYVFAYDRDAYREKADEIKLLIEQCEEQGINVQYEKADSNILDIYADRIQEFADGNLSENITSFQQTELDDIYNEVKTNLTGYLNGTKTPMPYVYSYKNGDKLSSSGSSLINAEGKPYYSVGFGHFNLVDSMGEFNLYGFDNVQFEMYPEAVLSGSYDVAGWNTFSGCDLSAGNGVDNSTALRVSSQGRLYQRTPVLPNTEYTLSFYTKGTGSFNYTNGEWIKTATAKPNSGWWREYTSTFTTGANTFAIDIEFDFNAASDVLLDNIKLTTATSDSKNAVINGDFEDDNEFGTPFYSDGSTLDEARKTLYTAEKENSKVCVLIRPNYKWDETIKTKYPEAFNAEDGSMILTNPTAKKLVEKYLRSAMNTLSEFDSLGSICLTNESYYDTSKYSAYKTEFQNYLKSVHGNISNLNSKYGSNYSDFSEIDMPAKAAATPLFYDWKNFNDKVFAKWHSFAAGIIKNCMPQIPVHAKVLTYMNDQDWNMSRHLSGGGNAELFDEFSDYIGNDGGAYLEEKNYCATENVMKWYDYLNSISDKPIYNSEDHITIDKGQSYNAQQADFTSGSIWQGAVHGKDISTIWIWSGTLDSNNDTFGHLRLRPKSISEVAKTKLDLNRLSEEVTAISNKQPDVGILYSDTARIYNRTYMNVIDVVYNAAIKSGNKVGFILNNTSQNKINKYKTIVVPRVLNIEKSMLEKLSAYLSDGGKLIIIDGDSLKKDEYDNPHDTSLVNSILNKSEIINCTTKTASAISFPTVEYMQQKLEGELKITDENGGRLSNVEWQSVKYEDGYLVSVFNYDKNNSEKIILSKNQKEFDNIIELISLNDVTSSYELKPLGKALFYVYNNIGKNNEIKKLNGTRSENTNKLLWTPLLKGNNKYYIFRVGVNGELSFIKETSETSFEENGECSAYVVKMFNDGELSNGKAVTCENEESVIFDTTEKQEGDVIKLNICAKNNNAYSIASELIVSAYNEDNSLAGVRIFNVILPAGRQAKFECDFSVEGMGYTSVRQK